ncbi:hypothetical protein KSS93_10500 [Pseudomonas xanthosomatis]|uniref:hypothetical protein n=1 Tax=Pseudomonas xanthosomatis TaxID=2842356 RepID=UPI001C3DE181|nr:hypothetical protein [Pseudomonas xanthosomatis]QXH48315.1 hypothetical protein KSS93_10500 [Pseudomonas xanthosomatis]
MQLFMYPMAAMANLFSMMLLAVGLSLLGKLELAAEVGLVHGATVAVFYSFSGNARSLILSGCAGLSAQRILRLRLMLLLPLCVLTWSLCAGFISDGLLFTAMLVVRRACEWLAEVFLSEQELRAAYGGLVGFILLQACGLCAVLLAVWLDFEVLTVVFLWACSPLAGCLGVRALWREAGRSRVSFLTLKQLLPHFGSTLAIGVSVYVFRLSIVLLAGKQLAGDLFAAFALGGMLGAVFSQALGPSMVFQERLQGDASQRRLIRLFKALLLAMALSGSVLTLIVWAVPGLLGWTTKSDAFWAAAGCSLVGGVVMVVAQVVRLRLLQHGAGRDVFGSDVLANLLLVACVPLSFLFLDEKYLATLYLVGALLSLAFYFSEDWRGVMANWCAVPRVAGAVPAIAQRGLWWVPVLVLGLFTPIFFQAGGGLYLGSGYFNSGGDFAKLPVPLSLLFCCLGMLLLAGYVQVRLVLVVVFLTFLGLWISALLTASGGVQGVEKSNLVLLVQYMIPLFGLVVGAQAATSQGALKGLAWALLGVLLVTMPLQLGATWWRGERLLSSSAVFFGVYQHLQYVPVIFCGIYLIALYSLWRDQRSHASLIIASGLIGVYTALSVSILALVLLGGGALMFLLRNLVLKVWPIRAAILVALLALGTSSGFMYISGNPLVAAKFSFPASSEFANAPEKLSSSVTPTEIGEPIAPQVVIAAIGHDQAAARAVAPSATLVAPPLPAIGSLAQVGQAAGGAPRNLVERMSFWRFYLDGVQESWTVFLFGHPQPPDRNLFPSAHNYYLDFVYNFGLVAMLPLLALILLTLYKVLTNLGRIFAEPGILAVAGVVAFLLLVDNIFKVGMRQPYSGIAAFFLWGFLLSWLSRTGRQEAGTQGRNPTN